MLVLSGDSYCEMKEAIMQALMDKSDQLQSVREILSVCSDVMQQPINVSDVNIPIVFVCSIFLQTVHTAYLWQFLQRWHGLLNRHSG